MVKVPIIDVSESGRRLMSGLLTRAENSVWSICFYVKTGLI